MCAIWSRDFSTASNWFALRRNEVRLPRQEWQTLSSQSSRRWTQFIFCHFRPSAIFEKLRVELRPWGEGEHFPRGGPDAFTERCAGIAKVSSGAEA